MFCTSEIVNFKNRINGSIIKKKKTVPFYVSLYHVKGERISLKKNPDS